jgi:hypothetical protein
MLDKLEFPFSGPQVILSSDRILLHSKKDAVIIAGKRAVSLCSTETINLDAKEKIILDSDIVELGHEARALGESVVLGNSLVFQLELFTAALKEIGVQLGRVGENKQNIAASITVIKNQGLQLESAAAQLEDSLQTLLSQNTFTR